MRAGGRAPMLGFGPLLTPLTKLGELGSELVYNCIFKSKTGVQVRDNVKICYFHEGSAKKVSYVNQELQTASTLTK